MSAEAICPCFLSGLQKAQGEEQTWFRAQISFMEQFINGAFRPARCAHSIRKWVRWGHFTFSRHCKLAWIKTSPPLIVGWRMVLLQKNRRLRTAGFQKLMQDRDEQWEVASLSLCAFCSTFALLKTYFSNCHLFNLCTNNIQQCLTEFCGKLHFLNIMNATALF